MPCVGVDSVDQMKENVRCWEDATDLNEQDMVEIERIRNELGDRFCRQCGYCQPCPQRVRIPNIFRLMNFHSVYGVKDWTKQQYRFLQSRRGSADACIECGECEEKCPQKIMIPEDLKKAHTLLTEGS